MDIKKSKFRRNTRRFTIIILSMTFIIGAAMTASGHGGKTHADDAFTPLKALQKATGLFDRLIVSGKIDESWETGLLTANITKRENEGRDEVVVSFKRSTGSPDTVYIFFTSDGKYAGSNFSGK